jgi:hypothetical protein
VWVFPSQSAKAYLSAIFLDVKGSSPSNITSMGQTHYLHIEGSIQDLRLFVYFPQFQPGRVLQPITSLSIYAEAVTPRRRRSHMQASIQRDTCTASLAFGLVATTMDPVNTKIAPHP